MSNKDIYILGIESSCDDTSAAVLKNDTVLSNKIANQSIHKKYGGVVPELASRAHLSNIIPVVESAIKESGISISDISAIAFTRGPGLMGSLIVGTEFAKSLGVSLEVPVIEVNHMQAHILSNFIENGKKIQIKGGKKDTTNNQMELLAPIEALKKIQKGSKVQIFTDSKYVKSGITEWIKNWKKNGWKTANKKEVKNKELWTELDNISNSFEIKWSWVKAHSTDKLNNEVDLLARSSTKIEM